MGEVSDATAKKARNIRSIVLRALADRSQARVADQMGIDTSNVGRWRDDHLDRLSVFLAACGLKVVPETAQTYDEDYIKALRHLADLGLHAQPPLCSDE